MSQANQHTELLEDQEICMETLMKGMVNAFIRLGRDLEKVLEDASSRTSVDNISATGPVVSDNLMPSENGGLTTGESNSQGIGSPSVAICDNVIQPEKGISATVQNGDRQLGATLPMNSAIVAPAVNTGSESREQVLQKLNMVHGEMTGIVGKTNASYLENIHYTKRAQVLVAYLQDHELENLGKLLIDAKVSNKSGNVTKMKDNFRNLCKEWCSLITPLPKDIKLDASEEINKIFPKNPMPSTEFLKTEQLVVLRLEIGCEEFRKLHGEIANRIEELLIFE